MTERTAGLGERRRALRMTQGEMAGRLGVSQGSLAAWETGLAYPSIDKLPAISREYAIGMGELVTALIAARAEGRANGKI